MAKEQKADFSCQTNSKSGSVVDAPCKPKCKVTYQFVFRDNLSLPYAVAIDGKVHSAFQARPKRTDGKITLSVDAGQTIQLYLNSDAHPDYRQQPVYKVVVEESDVEIVITETAGKHADKDTPVLAKTTRDEATGRTTQHMKALLTGDIWMKVSHRYSSGEVDSLVPADSCPEVIAAVKSIYAGLSSATLSIQKPENGAQSECSLTVKFIDSDNPKANITKYALLSDGLPRAHPGGYAALFNAALAHGIESLQVTSCWRPMLGSIAHRAGLGLDVGYVGATKMNRQELRWGKAKDTSNVSDEEVKRFKEYEAAMGAEKTADTAQMAAKKAFIKPGLSAEDKLIAQQRLRAANDQQMEASKAKRAAKNCWDQERDACEPAAVKFFRTSLLRCNCVAQLFDPWYMDGNAKDGQEAEPNMQVSKNEKLHAHHLHVTVYEPKIL